MLAREREDRVLAEVVRGSVHRRAAPLQKVGTPDRPVNP
jgi:hypothetical protein